MTRRRRRASSEPQRVGSDEGLTSSRPVRRDQNEGQREDWQEGPASTGQERAAAGETERRGGGRHTRPQVDQTKDDTDEGWGDPGDDDASARWLRENRPPHWS